MWSQTLIEKTSSEVLFNLHTDKILVRSNITSKKRYAYFFEVSVHPPSRRWMHAAVLLEELEMLTLSAVYSTETFGSLI
jgi:hypothetical protein